MIAAAAGSLPVDPVRVAAPLAALAASYLLFYEGLAYNVGRDGAFWRAVRSVLPRLDPAARERGFYTDYTVGRDEMAGVLREDPSGAVGALKDRGGIDSPLAAHKTMWDGETHECGSVGFFGVHGDELRAMSKPRRFLTMLLEREQDPHITLFPAEGGDAVVVTAHTEYSPYSPLTAFKHLNAEYYDTEEGVRRAREILSDHDGFEELDARGG